MCLAEICCQLLWGGSPIGLKGVGQAEGEGAVQVTKEAGRSAKGAVFLITIRLDYGLQHLVFFV